MPLHRRRAWPALPWLLLLTTSLVLTLVTPAGADSTRTGTPGSVAAQRAPGPEDDFPRLPARCYADDGSVADRPCRILTYGSARPLLALWGDSHAWMYLPAVQQLAAQRRVNLVLLLHGSCPPAVRLPREVDSRVSSCDKANDRARRFITQQRDRSAGLHVLISSFWAGYRADYRRMRREANGGPDSGVDPYHEHMARLAVLGAPPLFERLGRQRIEVDVVGQAGTVPTSPRDCDAGREPYQCDLPRARALDREAGNRTWLRARMRDLTGRPRLIDPSPAYCDDSTCFAHLGEANTWFDDLHLGAAMTSNLMSYFTPVLAGVRRRR